MQRGGDDSRAPEPRGANVDPVFSRHGEEPYDQREPFANLDVELKKNERRQEKRLTQAKPFRTHGSETIGQAPQGNTEYGAERVAKVFVAKSLAEELYEEHKEGITPQGLKPAPAELVEKSVGLEVGVVSAREPEKCRSNREKVQPRGVRDAAPSTGFHRNRLVHVHRGNFRKRFHACEDDRLLLGVSRKSGRHPRQKRFAPLHLA